MKIIKTKNYDENDFYTLLASVCGEGEHAGNHWIFNISDSEHETVEVENDNGEPIEEKKWITKTLSDYAGTDDSSYDYCLRLDFETSEGQVEYRFVYPEIEQILREKEVIENSDELEKIYLTQEDRMIHIVASESSKVKTLFRDVKKARASYRKIAGVAALLIAVLCPILIAFI